MSKMDIYVTNDNTVVRIDNGDGTHTAVYYQNPEHTVNKSLGNGILAGEHRGEPIWSAPKPKRYTVREEYDTRTPNRWVDAPDGSGVALAPDAERAQKIADALNMAADAERQG